MLWLAPVSVAVAWHAVGAWSEVSATLTHMRSQVGVRALQPHASEVVRRAAAGETVEITDRGRPVAQLVPLRASGLEHLLAAGLARHARCRLVDLAEPLPTSTGASLSELLSQQREHER